MYIRKTGYVVGTQNTPTQNIDESNPNGDSYKVIKMGRVLTRQEEGISYFNKSVNIASIANQGLDYYQVISNQGACERCQEHNGAIYPVAEAKDGENLPPFHPNCKCTIQGYSSANPNHDPWKVEILLWLDLMYGDGTVEQKAQRILDFYHWTEFSVEFISNVLSSIDDINHIGKRMEAFFSALDNPSTLPLKSSYSKIVVNHSDPSSSIEWKISNEDFFDRSAMTYEEILNIIKAQSRNPEWAANAERYARAIFDISQNFKHADFRLDTTWRHISYDDKLKALVPKGAVGINPKVILATLLAESEYGSTTQAFFGSTSRRVRQLDFEGQLDTAVNQYIQYYYWGLYAQGNMPELYDIQIQTGTGGSYTPANAAMYSRGQYCTDDLNVFELWQNIYLEGTFL